MRDPEPPAPEIEIDPVDLAREFADASRRGTGGGRRVDRAPRLDEIDGDEAA